MHEAHIRKDYSNVINLPSSNLTYPVRVCLELKSCDFSLGKVFPVTPGIFILSLVTGQPACIEDIRASGSFI